MRRNHGNFRLRFELHVESWLQGIFYPKLLDQLFRALEDHGVTCSSDRVVNYDIKPGVSKDEDNGDAWPAMLKKIMAAYILVIGTPIWMAQLSSVSKRVMEQLDAVLDDIDDKGRYPTFGKVGIVAVIGNEDGDHHVTAEIYQVHADVGFFNPRLQQYLLGGRRNWQQRF